MTKFLWPIPAGVNQRGFFENLPLPNESWLAAQERKVRDQATSKRSRFITLSQAATTSRSDPIIVTTPVEPVSQPEVAAHAPTPVETSTPDAEVVPLAALVPNGNGTANSNAAAWPRAGWA
ncbi:MAG TPA: hypothetical protein VH207_12020 [Chthoniobacterales bacterium]|nr:hypothetical protein [Chthoniobacterales bacterium]